jgi:hypothetical protein
MTQHNIKFNPYIYIPAMLVKRDLSIVLLCNLFAKKVFYLSMPALKIYTSISFFAKKKKIRMASP